MTETNRERAEQTAKYLRALALRIENHPDEFVNWELHSEEAAYDPIETVLEVRVTGREAFGFMQEVDDD